MPTRPSATARTSPARTGRSAATRRRSRGRPGSRLPRAPHAVRRLRPALDEVAKADEPVDLRALELGEHGVEADAVPVDVGEDADAHQARAWPPGARSACRSAPAYSARSSAIVGRTATAGTIGSQKLKTRYVITPSRAGTNGSPTQWSANVSAISTTPAPPAGSDRRVST